VVGTGASRKQAVIAGRRFSKELMYSAAALYYLEDASQADIAKRLRTSRATVSRVLSEARRQGIVRIEVIAPTAVDNKALSKQVAKSLGLDAVYIVPTSPTALTGASLATGLRRALQDVNFNPGDVLLVSTGRTVYEVARGDLPTLPGVVVAPMIGGHDEAEAWYQPNEIARQFASRISGHPIFLNAPALPGPDLHRILLDERSIQRVLELWRSARCAVLGIGAPPLTRESIPSFVSSDAVSLREAVGDVCSRFYDRDGKLVPFSGSQCLMSPSLEALAQIPVTIGVAVGEDKLMSIAVGARAGYFNRLVTDAATGDLLLALAHERDRGARRAEQAEGGAMQSTRSRPARTAAARSAR